MSVQYILIRLYETEKDKEIRALLNSYKENTGIKTDTKAIKSVIRNFLKKGGVDE